MGDSLHLAIANRGDRSWSGGTAWITVEESSPVSRGLPALLPGDRTKLAVAVGIHGRSRRVQVDVMDASGAIVLSRALISGPPNPFGGYILEAGDLAVGGNDFGRFGRIAAFRGFEWRDVELLTAAGFGVAAGGRLSDGMYTTTLGRWDLKPSPPAAETDWAPSRADTDVQATRAEFRFDDLEALFPIGLEIRAEAEASEVGGVASLTVTTSLRNFSGSRLPDVMPAMLADWDLTGGESVRWSDEMRALVSESRGAAGPVVVLASEGQVVARASVPLGTPGATAAYEADSGVLWNVFEEAIKLDLVRGGNPAGLPGFATATDRAPLLSVGPLDIASGESHTLRFWLIAADSEPAAAARLEELRDEPIEPPGTAGSFATEPPFPNPLRTGATVMSFPYSVPESAREDGLTLVFEIYDVAGRRLVRQTHGLSPTGELPRVTWDGRLADGLEAASGAYLYVFRLGDETRSGRIMIVH
jgi:hypothetical protein